MTILVLLGLTVVGFLILLDRKDSRASEAMQSILGAHRLELLGLLERSEREREAHRHEVAQLLQRIQAPQMAAIEHAQAQVTSDNDGLPPTDEQLAEEQQRAAALRQIDEIEADFAGRVL